jgi:hypothetical protein
MSTPPPEGKKPLSAGAIIGIVFVALVIIGAGICFSFVLG